MSEHAKIAITIDVEDWFQVENLRSVYPHSTWDSVESHVEKNTTRILELLEENKIKATFFVLGWVAERYSSLVRTISENGHEVASHGYSHVLNYSLSKRELKEDLERSKKLLEDITGKEVVGYRAPSFSISDEILYTVAEAGYKYDSSFNPFSAHDRYGTLKKYELNKPFLHESGIIEFPMPVLKFGKLTIPISGGGYFRIYPYWLFRRLVRMYLKNNDVFVFYIHPWEIDVEQPLVKKLRFSYIVRHYSGLKHTQRKLSLFLKYCSDATSFDGGCKYLTLFRMT